MLAEGLIGVPVSKFTCGNRAPVDLYLDLGSARFIKVVKAGDQFERHRLRTTHDPLLTKIYVRKTDFGVYLSYCLELAKRLMDATKKSDVKDFDLSGRVCELLFHSMREIGVSSTLTDRVADLVEVVAAQSQDSRTFQLFTIDLLNINDNLARHSFATTTMALAIVHGLGWQSEKNVKAIALGGLLHDVGLLHHPEAYKIPKKEWTPEGKTSYLKHPHEGATVIIEKQLVDDPRVVRIVADHEELPDGSGFPNAFGLSKIFPMALPIIMADRLTDLLLGLDSPLVEKKYHVAVQYLKAREERFFPPEYWTVLDKMNEWIQ